MRGMPAGRYIYGASILHRLDARAKIVSLFILIAAVIAATTIWGYILVIGVTCGIAVLSRLPMQTLFGALRRLWLFFITIFLMNAVFFADEAPIWSWWIFSLSAAGAAQGAKVVLRLALLMPLSNCLVCTTAPMDITNALESLIKPLRFIRIPVEDVAIIIAAAIQFIPTLLEESDMIRKAQIARGARFESKKLTEKAASVMPLVVPVFLAAFRRADELSIAMEARGYRNAKSRTKRRRDPLKVIDYAAVAASSAICAVQILFLL